MRMGFLENRRNLVKVLLDLSCIFLAVITAKYIVFEAEFTSNFDYNYFLIYSAIFLVWYIYRKTGVKSWSYTNSLDILSLVFINFGAYIGEVAYFALIRHTFSRKVIFLVLFFSISYQLFLRFLFRLNRSYYFFGKGVLEQEPILIYGGGEAGVALLRESITNREFPYDIKGFVDDDPKKRGTYINGKKVFGNFSELETLVQRYGIKGIIVAIPTIRRDRITEIITEIKKIDREIQIKILPGIDDILHGEGMLSQVRDVSIEDLLGREQILVNGDSIHDLICDKTVFVTGGAGSIGSELARQIAKHNPKKLVAIDVNENALYFLELELKRVHKGLDFQCEVCNIRELDKVDFLFNKYRPELVFHAAAHKHVPLMEHNPEEAIKNNIFGTKNVVDMAEKYGAERFVLISTDKAVNPTNIMGATKRGCELVVEEANKNSKGTKFMAVRFGNVLGSNGSVIPIFRELIAQGKNLTITHPDITRYFMTIPEAAQLVIEAGSLGRGGEVFILDMGEPVRIMDLAKKMIELSGADVEIEIVGLRPGEKLYEELLYDVNSAEKTPNKKIFITRLQEEEIEIAPYLEELQVAIKNPVTPEIKKIMKEFIISYREPEHHKN